MPPKPARRHHTVAQLYLAGFARQKVLAVHRRGVPEVIPVSIRRIAVESDFYGFSEGGMLDDRVEHWLAKEVDTPGVKLLGDLRAGHWPPTAVARDALAFMLGFQLLRTPRVRAQMNAIDGHLASHVALSTLHGYAARHGYAVDDPATARTLQRIAPLLASEALSSRDPRSFLRTTLREADRATHRIAAREWSLLACEHDVLLSSDHPVALFFPGGDPAGFTGVVPDDAQLLFPIDPKHLLVIEAVGTAGLPQAGALTAEYATIANTAQVRSAQRDVFRHPDMPWPEGLALPTVEPTLPEPTVRMSRSTVGSPTFPATYPRPYDDRVAALLRELGAEDTVE